MKSASPENLSGGSQVEGRVHRLRAELDKLCLRLENEVGPFAGTLFPGEIRSRYRMLHGLERELPDVFRPGEDARQIDVRHLPATLTTYSLETAIACQQLRRERYSHYSDTELILVLDLSLSMVTGHESDAGTTARTGQPSIRDVKTGCLGEDGPPGMLGRGDKLWGLYLAAGVFLTLGEQAGFVLRAIFANNGQAESDRALHPRDFRFRVLNQMTEELIQAYSRAENDHSGRENPSLLAGLEAALEVRARSVVVVVSDFLDPFSDYRGLLMECLARHHLVIIDVANWWEIAFPMPSPIWKGARWLDDRDQLDSHWRDAARRVEEGTEARPLRADQIEQWNKTVQAWRKELRTTIGRSEAGFCEHFRERTTVQAIQLANFHLGLVGK